MRTGCIRVVQRGAADMQVSAAHSAARPSSCCAPRCCRCWPGLPARRRQTCGAEPQRQSRGHPAAMTCRSRWGLQEGRQPVSMAGGTCTPTTSMSCRLPASSADTHSPTMALRPRSKRNSCQPPATDLKAFRRTAVMCAMMPAGREGGLCIGVRHGGGSGGKQRRRRRAQRRRWPQGTQRVPAQSAHRDWAVRRAASPQGRAHLKQERSPKRPPLSGFVATAIDRLHASSGDEGRGRLIGVHGHHRRSAASGPAPRVPATSSSDVTG